MVANRVGGQVVVREEPVVFPTYPALPADRNPMFLERRVNQGASGRVYPTPLTDRLSTRREERAYEAVFLENEYLELMLLPEIGGRVQAARDKTNGYDFLYRQTVIKPAFIGLFGPWISGGMEFNWPLHHRPTTFMAVAHAVERGPDGSCTVWLGEHEPMDRTKGMVGVCLHPRRSVVELKVQLYNRTPLPQTFLWWVNMAVRTNEQYQVIFPPDVWAVTDHSKRAMAHYPLARERYYGVDHGQGVDVSWHRNTPVPASYFVWETGYEFFGGYDHGRDAGIVHVANRHIAPGKKFFTWGTTGPAEAWERNLTDADGPYLELMAGVYTDNQPDFSWLQPFETRTFSQFIYPIHGMGPPQNADARLALHLEVKDGRAEVGAWATEDLPGCRAVLRAADRVLWEQRVDLRPGAPLRVEVKVPAGMKPPDVELEVRDGQGAPLLSYRPVAAEERELPEPYRPPPAPAEIRTCNQLYLTGLHVEQYRHPTIDPEPYWEEALRREPADARSHQALGLLHLRRGDLSAAESHLRQATAALTQHNYNPRDGEAHYELGLALRYQGRLDEAYACLYKAVWSYAWQAAGYCALAEIDGRRGQWERALEHLDRALETNARHLKARNLKVAALRRLGRLAEAEAAVQETMALDPLDAWSRLEAARLAYLAGDAGEAEVRRARGEALLRVGGPLGEVQMHLDVAFDHAAAGLWEEAVELLGRMVAPGAATHPMVLYARGYLEHQRGDEARARQDCARAAAQPPGYCFPWRVEERLALEHALWVEPEDARAHYYLGNLLFDKQRAEEAMAHWERAAALEPGFATPWRNLGIAWYNLRHDGQRARACYGRAFDADPSDGRVLCELDQLERRLGSPPEERLRRLEAHEGLVAQRDDLCLARITLLNQTGQPQRALDLVQGRRFIPWEGGEGRVSDQYVAAHLQLGRRALTRGDGAAALAHFEAARTLPENLGEGRSPFEPLVEVEHGCGLAHQALGDGAAARACFSRAAAAAGGPGAGTYHQALALRQLGREAEAGQRLRQLFDHARTLRDTAPEAGFATSEPRFVFEAEDPARRRRLQACCLMGLAHLGLGDAGEARTCFEEALALDPSCAEARQELRALADD